MILLRNSEEGKISFFHSPLHETPVITSKFFCSFLISRYGKRYTKRVEKRGKYRIKEWEDIIEVEARKLGRWKKKKGKEKRDTYINIIILIHKITGFYVDDYNECPLLGYIIPVHTSQETHYLSVAETDRLMLRKIWGFHGIVYEKFRLLGCYAVWLL
jgi:hypothetical protein